MKLHLEDTERYAKAPGFVLHLVHTNRILGALCWGLIRYAWGNTKGGRP